MQYSIIFPSDEEQTEAVIKRLISTGKSARNLHSINWWIAHHYLQGARNFTALNYASGTLDVSYFSTSGNLEFRYDGVVSLFQAQVGRLMQIDLTPKVQKRSIGLDDLKKSSIAQIALSYVFPDAKVDELKLKLCPMLPKYGAVGLAVWNEGEEFGIDPVPPWELIPIPPNPTEDTDVRGIIRIRIVPIDWVQALRNVPAKKSKVWGEMEKYTAPVGEVPTGSRKDNFTTFGQVTSTGDLSSSLSNSKSDKANVDLVEFAEIWLEDSSGHLEEYMIYAGDKLLHRTAYKQQKLYMPISVVNDIKTGGFWGRSFVSTQIPLNTELEYSIGQMFQTVQDMDAYGVLLEPTTLGIPKEALRGEDGIKRLRYEPDYSMKDLRPEMLQPVKPNVFAIKAISLGLEIAEKVANQPTELMKGKAPGRVDSNAALGFLYETSNMPLTSTAASIALGVSRCYRSILGLMGSAWDSQKVISVSMLDDAIAGVRLDAVSGQMSLESNPLPMPDEVIITVGAAMPKSKEQEKLELVEALKNNIIDTFEYRIEVRKRGLDVPTGGEIEWQNYRRSVLENILLFGDGKTPGQVIVSDSDMHNVHLRILEAFIARPEFYQATTEVRESFIKHREEHRMALGVYPDQMPYPEEAAEQGQQGPPMPQMPQMPPGGQQGPPMPPPA